MMSGQIAEFPKQPDLWSFNSALHLEITDVEQVSHVSMANVP